MLDAHFRILGNTIALLTAVEIAVGHTAHMRLRVCAPGAHAVRVFARIFLYGFWSSSV